MSSLRAASLLCVLALATCNTASGSFVFVSGTVQTVNGGAADPWNEFLPESGTNQVRINSTHGTMQAFVEASASPDGSWNLYAFATATATDVYLGALAVGGIQLTLTDRVTPTLSPGIDVDAIAYTQHFFIEGTSTGNASAPGDFFTSTYISVQYDSTTVMYLEEDLDSQSGFTLTMPRGDQSWTVGVTPNVPYNLRIDLASGAFAGTIENAGTAQGEADFSHTFRWGEVTDVRNAITGEPILASDFHLYGEDGFDWAHPAAVPEPTSFVLVGIGLVGLGFVVLLKKRRLA